MATLSNAGLAAHAEVIEGNPPEEIVKRAQIWDAGTVFVGARGLGTLERILLGSASTAAVTHSHCTVEVVRPRPQL